MITVSQILAILKNALENHFIAGKLTLDERHFILDFDTPTTTTNITNAINLLLMGHTLNKYKVPSLTKHLFVILREYRAVCYYRHVDLSAVVRFILFAVYDSGIIPLHDTEKTTIQQLIYDSLYLLNANAKIIPKRISLFGCLG